ncbi:hypothetical protein IVB36_26075 [Bradyrhizobium sp. 35]|uniref:hypothetical protein n=1 Tax=unclassified Bradyrhizobium TaxID=2631580 RepID=UPI0018E02905|nr:MULTISPECIES: hypothetical protein [unclassified Bradyrhizobium]MCK1454243.1 hypothetical protein [Bradyrhizobium sp. 35]
MNVHKNAPLTPRDESLLKTSRKGMRAPILLVRAAQSGPLVVKMAMSRLSSGMDANTSG